MARKPPKGKSLAEVNPELAKEWHPTKNGDLSSFDFTKGSNNKVWWKCPVSEDHEWEAIINNRNRGKGCAVCSGHIVVLSNCLSTLNPDLSKEWHPTKNKNLTPFDVGIGWKEKVWWKCSKGEDHEWESNVYNRHRGSGCPVCKGDKVVLSNCLATTHPDLAKEWHSTKNGDLSTYDVCGGHTKHWWKCSKGEDHEWETSIINRKSGTGCPICSGNKVVLSNCLATTHPEIAKEWHSTMNGDLTPFDISFGAITKFWWKCSKGEDHEWESTIPNRVRGYGCLVCSGYKVVISNCLATTNPDLAKEWHPTKNGDLTSYDVCKGGHTKFWWKCSKGEDHEWESNISNRLKGSGCAVCSNMKTVLSNCLATTHPDLAKEWHPTMNEDLTPFDIVAGSNTKYWWKCSKGKDHEWITSTNKRAYGNRGCPYCTLTPQSKQELTITFELIQFFKDINPKGFKTRLNGKLWTIDIYIPKLNLGIEFDGSYWHKDKRALDKLKTKQLKKEGFDIVRVRQSPLKKIFRTDILSKQPFNGKEVANKVLKQIMKMYDLDAKKVRKIENYLDKKELQNEKGLDKYIDMILTEKAEKNN